MRRALALAQALVPLVARSARQAVVRMEIDNRAYDGCDSDWITLSAVSARSLAQALLAIADDIERAGQGAA